MAENKKIMIYGLIIIFAVAAYLALAHFFIYYRIGVAGLKMVGRQDAYVLGAGKAGAKDLSYVALGDSLTAGIGAAKYEDSWPYLLARKLAGEGKNKITLKSFSYPGAKTADLIDNLLEPAVAAKPDMITLLIGTNDAYGKVSPAAFKKNYRLILERLTKETKADIYLIGLPFLGSPELLLKPYNYYFYFRTKEFNEIIRELAGEYKLKYVDLAMPVLIESEANRSYYAADLFHPSAEGYKFWAKIIYDDINQ